MSDRRKSSAPLSSQTQQWALEDEEEQEQERRQRLWNLRFTMDEDLPAPESTSMRLPASSVKLGLKLEQYLSAIQRSESVRDANPFHTEFPVAPVDVTSKRHLFEKELVGQSREGPATSRKENLELSGVVKSRLNLWISRTQESAQQGPQNQETQRDLAARSKPQWRKKPEALLGAERSEFIRDANRFHAEFPVAPVDVTSKRHLFEKKLVGQSREGPAISCKENLELSGLKSQLSLWISRTQESAQQGPQNQETQRDLAARSKPQWRKKPEALLSAAKISVLEERADSGKRAVPGKASNSEKRPVSEKVTVFEKTPVPEIQPAPGRTMAPVPAPGLGALSLSSIN
ncbi:hypothetical protein MJT46_000756 [Ovis ammon polii x Ovis aries]|nr:hypothetical protein MJT46_000756 [Ovis ammon polii x Ovis aries]